MQELHKSTSALQSCCAVSPWPALGFLLGTQVWAPGQRSWPAALWAAATRARVPNSAQGGEAEKRMVPAGACSARCRPLAVIGQISMVFENTLFKRGAGNLQIRVLRLTFSQVRFPCLQPGTCCMCDSTCVATFARHNAACPVPVSEIICLMMYT